MATIDVVYALHDFGAENEDELSFKSGDKIEVVEKDDEFGDGWWQGHIGNGKVGLFPRDYTTPNPPPGALKAPEIQPSASTSTATSNSTILPSLSEEPEETSPPSPPRGTSHGTSTPQFQLNDQEHKETSTDHQHRPQSTIDPVASRSSISTEPGGEVMKATMTDVQAALDDFDRRSANSRTISFVSERDFTENETDDDHSDLGEGSAGWHKGAREKLAEKAKKALEEAEKMERMIDEQQREHTMNMGLSWQRLVNPPIEVEMSDESEGEDDDDELRRRLGSQSSVDGIAEESEPEEDEDPRSYFRGLAASRTESRHDDDDELDLEDGLKTATRSSFPVAHAEESFPADHSPAQAQSPYQSQQSLARSASPSTTHESSTVNGTPIPASLILLPHSDAQSSVDITTDSTKHHSLTGTSPASTTPPIAQPLEQPQTQTQLHSLSPTTSPLPISSALPISPISMTHGGVECELTNSSSSGPAVPPPMVITTTTPMVTAMETPMATAENNGSGGGSAGPNGSGSGSAGPSMSERKHPSEWGVNEVIEWLKARGFDQDTSDKFIEQEITGDVLLELDANLLKSEIGIMAFGKRVRIANAIAELRRPPSINYDSQSFIGGGSVGGGSIPYTPSSLGFSQHQQHVNGNGSGNGSVGGYTAGTPPPVARALGFGNGHSRGQSMQSSLGSPFSSMAMPMATGQASSLAGGEDTSANADANSVRAGSDSGVVPGKGARRPSQLILSPSDGALNATAAMGEADKDKGALSESELPSAMSMRRRLFGRSHDSGVSSKSSKEHKDRDSISVTGSPLSTASFKIKEELRKSKEADSPKSPKKDKDKERERDKEQEKDQYYQQASSKAEPEAVARPRTKGRKSVDNAGKSSDRLSLFGIGGGKGRKPVPRYSSVEEEPEKEKESAKSSSGISLSRLYGSQNRRSGRSSTGGDISTPRNAEFATSSKSSDKHASMSPPPREPQVLRKRTSSTTTAGTAGQGAGDQSPIGNGNGGPSPVQQRPAASAAASVPSPIPEAEPASSPLGQLKIGQSILEQIGHADHYGWMRKKGDRYNNWKLRYFVLKGPHMYCLRSNSKTETKIKGYINIIGYKVVVDENINPGKYGFRIVHDNDKPHAFSSEEKGAVREWMKAIMKATIGRDYTKAVISSCNIPTIPLVVAQAMNPAPRPPSPTQRAATQRAMRRENPHQLSSRDARVLMGLSNGGEAGKDADEQSRTKLESFFSSQTVNTIEESIKSARQDVPMSESTNGDADGSSVSAGLRPPRPSREFRRASAVSSITTLTQADEQLIEWVNRRLPPHLRIQDPTTGPLLGGLGLLRLAEAIKGRPLSPPVPDSAFPVDNDDDTLDGLFRLFDFLLDNDVKMGSVSINDVRQGKPEKILQLMKALKAWEDKRRTIAESIGKGSVHMGAFMAPVGQRA